jgi:PAS domain S-box-containing protein
MVLLDIKTILITNLIMSVVCVIILVELSVQYKKRYKGLYFWLADFVFQVIAAVLMMLRNHIPDWISIVLANILVMMGFMSLYIGLERFMEKKSSQIHNYIFIILFALVHIYFTFFDPNINFRNINLSIGMSFFSIQILWLILKRLEPSSRNLAAGVSFVFIAYTITNLVRIIYLILFPQQNNNLFQLGDFNAMVIFVYMLLLFILTYNLVAMANRRMFEEGLLQEEKFNKAFHSSPNAIIITRKSDGKIIELNEGFENITGYSRNEVIGKTTGDLKLWVNEDDRTKVINALAKHGRIADEEFFFRKNNGKLIQTLYFAESIKINGEPCILTTGVDITQLKKNELALKETKKKLEDTLEDFYMLRIGMANDMKKNQVDTENRKIRKRIDKLKKLK